MTGCCGPSFVDPHSDSASRKSVALTGPAQHRHCTDVLWLILFLAFWVGMVVIAVLAFAEGNPRRITNGHDSYGNICGYDNEGNPVVNNTNAGLDMSQRSYVFYFEPTSDTGLRICVKSCPTDDGNATTAASDGLCLGGNDPYKRNEMEEAASGAVENGTGCAVNYFKSSSVFRRCVPSETDVSSVSLAAAGVVSQVNDEGVASHVVSDLNNSWQKILTISVASLVASYVVCFLLQVLACVLIWTVYFATMLGTIALIVHLWYTYANIVRDLNDTPTSQRLTSQEDNADFYLALSIVVTILGLILLAVLIAVRKRLQLVVALFKEAGRSLRDLPGTLLVPFVHFIAFGLLTTYFLAVLLYVHSITEAEELPPLNHAVFDDKETLVSMQWYHIIGFLWTVQFFGAVQQCVVAGAVATWYFALDKKDLGSPVSSSFGRTTRYHLGSLAFGSLLIAIVQVFRVILGFIHARLKGRTGAIAGFLLKCLACCFWCLEHFLKFINHNVYVEIALRGQSFFAAAHRVFALLFRNILRVAAVNVVGDFVLLVGRLAVVIGATIWAIAWFESDDDIEYTAVPTVLVAVIVFFVTGVVFSVFESAVNTIFICFVEDSESNDGSLEKPYFMSDNMLKFMDDAGKAATASSSSTRTSSRRDSRRSVNADDEDSDASRQA